MCNFLSLLVTERGRVYSQPELSDHHTQLLPAFPMLREPHNLEQMFFDRNWRKAEFLPASESGRPWSSRDWSRLADADTYELRYDDEIISPCGVSLPPKWWDFYYDAYTDACRERIRAMTITSFVPRLDGGAWIVAAGGHVGEVTDKTRIVSCAGQIDYLGPDATIDRAEDSARIDTVDGRVQGLLPGAAVQELRGRVDVAWARSRIGRLRGTIGLAIDAPPELGHVDCRFRWNNSPVPSQLLGPKTPHFLLMSLPISRSSDIPPGDLAELCCRNAIPVGSTAPCVGRMVNVTFSTPTAPSRGIGFGAKSSFVRYAP